MNGNRCFYCDDTDGPFQEDHVVPISRGGTSLPRNLVLACALCNSEKNDRLPSEWRADLHDRVYQLEQLLRDWHREVADRKRRQGTSLPPGHWAYAPGWKEPLFIEAVDGQGIRYRFLEVDMQRGMWASVQSCWAPRTSPQWSVKEIWLVDATEATLATVMLPWLEMAKLVRDALDPNKRDEIREEIRLEREDMVSRLESELLALLSTDRVFSSTQELMAVIHAPTDLKRQALGRLRSSGRITTLNGRWLIAPPSEASS
jgi:hypothetical protein